MSEAMPFDNVVEAIRLQAEASPERTALVCHDDQHRPQACSFAELWAEVEAFAGGLDAEGFERGQRVMLLAPLSPTVYAFVLALLARGVTAVLIDASVRSRGGLAHAIKTARPRALLTVDALAKRRALWPPLWGMRVYSVDGPRLGVRPLSALRAAAPAPCRPVACAADDECFVTFTSGSTGKPKAVNRTHGVSTGQHYGLVASLEQEPGDVHLTTLPVLALHNLACGVTTVLPPLDAAAPDAEGLARTTDVLMQYAATRISGAPRFVVGLAAHLTQHQLEAPTVRHVVTGAAPVTRRMCAQVVAAFPQARAEVLYGSTEAEPMSHVDMRDVIAEPGDGFLVGRVQDPNTELEVVQLPTPAPELDARGVSPFAVPDGTQGEIVVAGPQVVKSYLQAPEADRQYKLRDATGRVWHRTGDVGYRDPHGRLWLTGRVADMVKRPEGVLGPLSVEAAISELEGVEQVALLAHRGAPTGELLLRSAAQGVDEQVRRWLDGRGLSDVPVVSLDEIPLDPRNGSKLDRPRLRALREAR